MIPIIEETTASAAQIIDDVNDRVRALILDLSTGSWEPEQVILALNDIAMLTANLADTVRK